jgi:transketolase N-terminal domain/subunit/transketolase C-terminal domain/subunit
MNALATTVAEQSRRNTALLAETPLLRDRIESHVLPLTWDLKSGHLTDDEALQLGALEKTAATIAIKSLISLAKAGDLDHLGGGLELIPALLMTLGIVDFERHHYVIEHGHTSIGYYAALSALGFLPEERVVDKFRRSLDIAGHVSWVPGGTPLGSGRLGVMMPVASGLALGLKAKKGADAFVVCHCGDAGWISGQALNGFIGATQHHAPIAFVMHRNGIQLSGTTRQIIDRDPRPIIGSLGVEILEIPTLHDRASLARAYGDAFKLAQSGKPSLIYPVGFGAEGSSPLTVADFGRMYGIAAEVEAFAKKHNVVLETRIRIPGSLMSFRDSLGMIQCVFYVNGLPGGEGQHDGGMKGRDGAATLANPMLAISAEEQAALDALRGRPLKTVVTQARPAKGSPNLVLSHEEIKGVQLPGTDKWVTPRAGSEAAYVAVARKFPDRCFFVSCDLNPSTKLGKAADLVQPTHRFEMSIEEQASSLMVDGLSFAGRDPQLNVFATFGAFLEGIAREGFEMWRYQRNLNGLNEGLNVVMHFSHVGACTGRDHFSGWSLDWINLALGYLPFLRRFYAPADARAAFLAVRDAAAEFGGHIIGIPRDNLPVLTKSGTTEPLWTADEPWTAITRFRQHAGAEVAVLSIGAPSYLAGAASDKASASGVAADVYVINGFPLSESFIDGLSGRYKKVITVEDGLIGTVESGLRGFAAYVATELYGSNVALDHFGIVDPHIAPSDHFLEVWKHYGITEDGIARSIASRNP